MRSHGMRCGVPTTVSSAAGEFELVVQPHHSLYDGRFGGNGWLEEMPEPAGKLVWDNAAAVSPAVATISAAAAAAAPAAS